MYTNSVFEEKWWLEAVGNGKAHEIIIKDTNDIIARWCFVKQGKKVLMPPQTQACGIWFSDTLISSDYYYKKRKDIINKMIELSASKFFNISLDVSNDYFLPFIWRGFNVYPRITYRIESLEDIQKVYSRFANIVKKNIKSALHKVNVIEGHNVTPLYSLLQKTFGLQQRKYPYSFDFIDNLYKVSLSHNSAKLLYAYDINNNLHSGALFIYDSNVCYYLIAGTDPAYRSSGANSLVIWKGIQFASTVSKTFDFEGSMIEGIENFVKQFGGIPKVYYEIKRETIFKQVLNVFKPYVKRFIGYKV